MQVLQFLDGERSNEVFAALPPAKNSAAMHRVLSLPQDLLSKWVAAAGPTLDLSTVCLPESQWVRLSMAISQAHPEDLISLQVAVGPPSTRAATTCSKDTANTGVIKLLKSIASSESMQVSHCCSCGSQLPCRPAVVSLGFKCKSLYCTGHCATLNAPQYTPAELEAPSFLGPDHLLRELHSFCTSSTQTQSRCSMCSETTRGQPALLVLGSKCPLCKGFCVSPTAPSFPAYCIDARKVHVDITQQLQSEKEEPFPHPLCALGAATSEMINLKHLGLHQLPFSSEVFVSLGQVFRNLPSSVTELTLAFKREYFLMAPHERGLLFEAVALIRGLEVLRLPTWYFHLQMHACGESMCFDALRSLPRLRAVIVPHDAGWGGKLPAGLPFKTSV